MEDAHQKLVVVTGGTKGIGRAIAELFVRKGYPVAACARNDRDLASLGAEMEAIGSGKVYTMRADLSKKEETVGFGHFVKSIGKTPHVLVNNTGTFQPGSVRTEEEGLLESLIETNLYSAYRLTRELLPAMCAEKSGHIFNICSIASLIPYAPGASYGISKFALYGFSKALREDLKTEGIKVTSVLPGATFTPTWEGVEVDPERLMKPTDIAEAIWSCYNLSSQTVVEDLLLRPQLGDL